MPADTTTAMGAALKAHFQFSPGWRNLNHGSFGSIPRAVTEQLRRFQDECEASPDVFMRYTYCDYLLAARRAAAKVLHAPLNRLVLVQNATTGVNVALRNLQYAPTDHIIVFSTIYYACDMTVRSLAETTGARVTVVPLVFPTTHAAIVAAFQQALAQIRDAGETPRVAVFDTVVATPAARMPFEALTRLCRAEGVLSVVDAAHGAGLLPLDLEALDPDFLVTNLHKWLFVPRGCAAMYVAERSQALLRTALPTSWGFVPEGAGAAGTYLPGPAGYKQSAFETLFETVGTIDMSAYFCVPAAVKWREEVCGGEAAVHAYLVALGAAGAQRVADLLGTEMLDNADGELTRDLAMRNVRLPLDVAALGAHASKALQFLGERMVRANTFAPPALHGGHVWVRMCAQVYLDEDDFGYLAQVLAEACREIVAGAYLQAAK